MRQRPRVELSRLLADPSATHYQVLGVSPGDLSPETLTHARKIVALLFHPDLQPESERGIATQLMARANQAHAVLEDKRSRVLYDAQLRTTHAPCPACDGAGGKAKLRGFTGRSAFLECLGCRGEGWVPKQPALKKGRKA